MKRKLFITVVIILGILIATAAAYGVTSGFSPVKGQLNLGYKLLEEGKYEEAILAFEKVIQIDPKNIESRIHLSKAYYETGSYDKAEKVLKDALDIAPKKPEIYMEFAKLYMNQWRVEEAVKILEQGYELTKDEKLKAYLDELKKEQDSKNNNITEEKAENAVQPQEEAETTAAEAADVPLDFRKLLAEGRVDNWEFILTDNTDKVINSWGEPDEKGVETTDYMLYKAKNVYIYYYPNNGRISSFYVSEAYGIKDGMTEEEIIEVLGEPYSSGISEMDGVFYMMYKEGSYQMFVDFNQDNKAIGMLIKAV